jgi:hypothetical protein
MEDIALCIADARAVWKVSAKSLLMFKAETDSQKLC